MVATAGALPAVPASIVGKHFESHNTSGWSSLLWSVESVRAARDAQIKGNFRSSADLAEYAKTDPGIFKALLNRIAPHRGLPIEVASETAPDAALTEARRILPLAVPTDVNADSFEHVAQLGLSVEQVDWTPRADGSRIDPVVTPWPMRTVWVDSATGALHTHTKTGIETITHGDGKWIVTKLHSAEPWQWGAIKALSDSWAQRTYARRDRQLNSETHGEGKFIGTLPEGIELDSEMGRLYSEWVAGLRNHRSGGVKAHGYEVTMLEAVSQMWQIFKENITAIDKDIAGAYLGQDGSMVNEGGNYIKTALLFGVRNDIVEGDLGARGEAISTGLLRPWSLLNFGRDFALKMAWCFPDADLDARLDSYAKRVDAFNRAISEYKNNGFAVTQEWVNEVASRYSVDAPTLQPKSSGKGEITEYLITFGILSIDEVREAKGFGPKADGTGGETVPERDARLEQEKADAAAAAQAEADARAAEEAEKAREEERARREEEAARATPPAPENEAAPPAEDEASPTKDAEGEEAS
jgi:hypothetical protein